MSSISNASCPHAAIPDDLPIPTNITYMVIPGQNTSDPWMVTCCDPYPVQLVETCWEWCQIDPSVVSNTSSDDIFDHFSDCLKDNKWGSDNKSSSILMHKAAGVARDPKAALFWSCIATLITIMALAIVYEV